MQIGPFSAAILPFLAIVGFVEATDIVAPKALQPVHLKSVEYDPVANSVIYTRKVVVPRTVRAAWRGDMVVTATERGVPECEVEGRADYGPHEPTTQTWAFADFFSAECQAALVSGTQYEIWAAVDPVVGEPDEVRSEPFIWP